LKKIILIFFLLLGSFSTQASGEPQSPDEPVDAFGLIMDHISDAHQWHVVDYTNSRGHEVHINVPLPVILWHNNSLWFFSSGHFYHEQEPQQLGNDYVILHEEQFYITGMRENWKWMRRVTFGMLHHWIFPLPRMLPA